ncbi:hypothetical protein ABNG02_02505 [Halorubrum ejinorense]|uniref:Gins51 C-terminal domain-containing protein n=1 Tax=Halorubrum ejinorense TaxID=425309 RepID=A0AAV3SMM5_9EURY
MNLDELRSAQAKERRKDSLQHLRDSFYDDVGAYVADLRAARDRRAEQVENPFEDDDIRRLSDEVETAEEVAEALYERRVGKVVKLASFAAADMSVDEDGMTAEERRLFDDLVERITANKSQVLDVLAGESPVSDDTPVPDDTPVSDEPGTADAPPLAEESAQASGAEADRAGSEPTPAARESASTDRQPTSAGSQTADAEGASADASASADAGALAGAMGGDGGDPTGGDGSTDLADGDAVSSAPDPDDAETGPRETTRDGASDGEAETPVPPEPAPPGAVGVGDETDDTGEADGLTADAPADDAEEGPGATTDGGSMPESPAGAAPGAGSDASTDRTTVRITRDVGAIFGVDEREYDLASEDVVSLPVENADPLVQRDAAERID